MRCISIFTTLALLMSLHTTHAMQQQIIIPAINVHSIGTPSFLTAATKRIGFEKTKKIRAYNAATKKDLEIFEELGPNTALWFEEYVAPNIANMPLKNAQQIIAEAPQNALAAYLRDKHSVSTALLVALPTEITAKEIVPRLFDCDAELADIFNQCSAKRGIGKALEYYTLINESKGVPLMTRSESFALLCNSPETYNLCKRLIPEFRKQTKYIPSVELEKQNIKVSRSELSLLCQHLPDNIKKRIKENHIIPQSSLTSTGINVCGHLGTLALLITPIGCLAAGGLTLREPLVSPFVIIPVITLLTTIGAGNVYLAYWVHGLSKKWDKPSLANPLTLPERLYNTDYEQAFPKEIGYLLPVSPQ
jgi:hypothetical protein